MNKLILNRDEDFHTRLRKIVFDHTRMFVVEVESINGDNVTLRMYISDKDGNPLVEFPSKFLKEGWCLQVIDLEIIAVEGSDEEEDES